MLTWEFPPRIVGGISTHTYYLSRSLARKNLDVQIITCDFPAVPNQQTVDGVRILRVNSSAISHTDLLLWTLNMNSLMTQLASEILTSNEFDLIHAHDWLVGKAAHELKRSYKLPLITTIHSTEAGRIEAIIPTSKAKLTLLDYNKAIVSIEQHLLNYSDRIICCSNYMANQIKHTFGIHEDRIDVISNGVDIFRFNPDVDVLKHRIDNFWGGFSTTNKGERMILFVGRLVHEKGVHILINAFEKLLRDQKMKKSNAYSSSLIIIGEGPVKQSLKREVQRLGLEKQVHFLGFVDGTTLVSLYGSADVLVVPSLYEPFGIVVLEAMSSRMPVIVSDVGGLAEIVKDGITGLKFPAGNADYLAAAIKRVLEEPSLAESLILNAYRDLMRKYDWDLAAQTTIETYKKVLAINDDVSKPATKPCSVEEVALVSDSLLGNVDEGYYLTDHGTLQALFTLGVTKEENSRTALEISNFIGITENSVKLILGRLAAQGYVSVMVLPTITKTDLTSPDIRYHLTERGINGACTGFS